MAESVTHKIDKGVPIPRRIKNSVYATLASDMDQNDSVLFGTQTEARSLAYAIKSAGYESVSRKVSDGNYRVWKTAKLEAK